MESNGWVELVSYVSDLGSLLDLETGLDGGSLRIGLDGASITVVRLSEGWVITYENYSEGVRIRVWNGEAEYYRDGRPCMRGLDSGAHRSPDKALALIVGLAAAHSRVLGAVSPDPLLIRSYRPQEIYAPECGPVDIQEDQLAVGYLPEQEVADPLLSRRPDY
jgi:hypothetical protein